ncbi:hypothetical protein PCASD_18754 [Puccinia coronata f. sp. avenae]|uniref:Uncharacterized protein n=1 Tax=Puccinia coronata f. sp. avenae TaxID=200324 RepID=A0A2N5TQU8_9BASI|nr:hypothetical protein PCASD_18754 [Puccinia coronata f. sp. avenae]
MSLVFDPGLQLAIKTGTGHSTRWPIMGLPPPAAQPPAGSPAGGLARWAPVGRPAQPINSCGSLGPGHLSVFPANGSPNPTGFGRPDGRPAR